MNPAPNATGFDYPKVMQYADGKLWIGENDGNDIQVYDPSGNWIHRFGLQGSAVGDFKQGVQGLYVGPVGGTNYVFATDVGNCRLQVWSEATLLGETAGPPLDAMGACGTGSGQMSAPRGVVARRLHRLRSPDWQQQHCRLELADQTDRDLQAELRREDHVGALGRSVGSHPHLDLHRRQGQQARRPLEPVHARMRRGHHRRRHAGGRAGRPRLPQLSARRHALRQR